MKKSYKFKRIQHKFRIQNCMEKNTAFTIFSKLIKRIINRKLPLLKDIGC